MAEVWRDRLLAGVLAFGIGGWLWLFIGSPSGVQATLGLLLLAFTVGTAAVFHHYRAHLTARLLTANVALGVLVHLLVAGMVVVGDRLGSLGPWAAMASHWQTFFIAVAGIGAAFFTWTRARGRSEAPALPARDAPPEPVPRPEAAPATPDWEAAGDDLRQRGDGPRLVHLEALRRIDAALDPDQGPDAARRVLYQEVQRLVTASRAAARDDDLLTQASELLVWGVDKLPELAELDVSDLLMAKAIADIRAGHSAVEHRFVDHRELVAIHPIDRATAEEKCEERAAAARAALPLLRANGMRLSEALIAAEPSLEAFASVTGFQVISLGEGEGYVTFEGNGRREALQRAFGDEEGVLIEVREFCFDDPETAHTMRRRVQRVRRWKGMT